MPHWSKEWEGASSNLEGHLRRTTTTHLCPTTTTGEINGMKQTSRGAQIKNPRAPEGLREWKLQCSRQVRIRFIKTATSHRASREGQSTLKTPLSWETTKKQRTETLLVRALTGLYKDRPGSRAKPIALQRMASSFQELCSSESNLSRVFESPFHLREAAWKEATSSKKSSWIT